MISVPEALHLIQSNLKPNQAIEVPVAEAAGCILAEHVYSKKRE
jgi:molybdopterin biosynthesis enzyme